jgi:hypothetical protein
VNVAKKSNKCYSPSRTMFSIEKGNILYNGSLHPIVGSSFLKWEVTWEWFAHLNKFYDPYKLSSDVYKFFGDVDRLLGRSRKYNDVDKIVHVTSWSELFTTIR